MKGLNAEPLKKISPDFLLSLCFSKGLLDQLRIKLRLLDNSRPLLYFPKTRLQRARGGERLSELMAPVNVHKPKTGKSISQQSPIIGCRISKRASISQSRQEIIEIPTH
jgi:hypothetical protein